MSKPVVLFGTGKIAEVVHHFMVHEAVMTVAFLIKISSLFCASATAPKANVSRKNKIVRFIAISLQKAAPYRSRY